MENQITTFGHNAEKGLGHSSTKIQIHIIIGRHASWWGYWRSLNPHSSYGVPPDAQSWSECSVAPLDSARRHHLFGAVFLVSMPWIRLSNFNLTSEPEALLTLWSAPDCHVWFPVSHCTYLSSQCYLRCGWNDSFLGMMSVIALVFALWMKWFFFSCCARVLK